MPVFCRRLVKTCLRYEKEATIKTMRKSKPSLEQQLLKDAVKDIASKRDEQKDDDKNAAERASKKSEGEVATLPMEGALAPAVHASLRPLVKKAECPPVVVCFGTSSISGDALGPQVGTLLRETYRLPAFVYGTEDMCVNGKNMGEWMEFIKSVHAGSIFIAVDASLGNAEKVGKILIRNDGVCPAAIKGKKTRFGDVGILAVVAENKGDALMQLMTAPSPCVEKMARRIACAINMCFA